MSSVWCCIPLPAAFAQRARSLEAGEIRGKQETHLQAGGEPAINRLSLLRGRAASVAVAAPGPQPWQGPADVTSGEGSFTQAEREGWDCWVSHSGVLGMGIKSVGSAWPCGFLSFWAGICTSRRSCWVDGICNRFIFPGLKILCKLGFYFPFLTAEPRSGGNECVIPL